MHDHAPETSLINAKTARTPSPWVAVASQSSSAVNEVLEPERCRVLERAYYKQTNQMANYGCSRDLKIIRSSERQANPRRVNELSSIYAVSDELGCDDRLLL